MTLGTHAVVGGAVAMLFPSNPMIGFVAGFASHFILDAIPHWDYKILSAYANPNVAMSANAEESGISQRIQADRYFKLDLLRTGSDVLLGLLVLAGIWYPALATHWYILLIGAIAGMLPDFLQFVYMRFPYQPMVAHQKFHAYMHAKLRLNDRPILGVSAQIATIIFVTLLVRFLIRI